MPKILITGNGFDLHHNLPTSYYDFINIVKELDNITVYNFDNVFKNHTKIKKNYKNEIIFDLDKIEKIKELANKNIWFSFFKEELEIDTWIDFENKIQYVLNLILNGSKLINENCIYNQKRKIKLNANDTDFNHNIEIINIFTSFNIIDEIITNGINNETKYKIKFSYLKKVKEYISSFNLEKIANDLYQSLLEFNILFNLYFETFVVPLYDLQKNINDKLLFTNIDYHFTFNYTPTFNKSYWLPDKSNITHYLHGKISNDNKLVLGINEVSSEIKESKYYKDFIPFVKYFQKLNYNTDYRFLKEIDVIDESKIIDDNLIFIFFGHSLDISDSDYINEVFNLSVIKEKSMYEVENSHKIFILIHEEKSKFNYLQNLIKIRGKEDIEHKMKNGILEFELIENIAQVLNFPNPISIMQIYN